MSTFDSAAVWSATSLAFDEKKIGAAGLSVRQRKLLALLSQPASLPQLAQSIALPIEDVQASLERFAKLGFAQSSDAVPLTPMQTQLRSPSAVEAPSRMPLMIGVAVAALAAVGAAAWLLRGGSSSAPAAPVATATKAQAPTATGPSDMTDNGLPGPVTRQAAPPAAAPVAAPATAANTAANAAATVAGRPSAAPAAQVTPPTSATPAPASTAAGAPAKAAATPAVVAAAASPAVAPTVVAPTTPALALATALPTATAAPAAPAPQPAAAPAVAAPAVTPPPTQVATAPATSAPAAAARPATAAAREIKLVNRVEPAFPRGYDADKGTVRARLQVDARGAVTSVDIVEASPPRVFDRTVRTALQQWRYEPTGEAFSVIAEINFTR